MVVSFNGISSSIKTDTTLTLDRKQVPVELRQGEVIMANVKAVLSDNKAVIEIDGRTLVAETKIKLFPGQQLLLEVKGATDNQLVQLAVIADSAKSLSQLASLGAFARVFAEGNLEPTKANLHIAAELVGQGLPAAPEDIKEVARLVQQVPPDQLEKAVAAAVLVKAKGLPMKPAQLAQAMNLSSTKEVLQGLAELSKNLVQLAQEHKLPGVEFSLRSLVKGLTELMGDLQRLVKNHALVPDEGKPPQEQQAIATPMSEPERRSSVGPNNITSERPPQSVRQLEQLVQKIAVLIAELEVSEPPMPELARPTGQGASPSQPRQAVASEDFRQLPGSSTLSQTVSKDLPHALPLEQGVDMVVHTKEAKLAASMFAQAQDSQTLEVKLGDNSIKATTLLQVRDVLRQLEELVLKPDMEILTPGDDKLKHTKVEFRQLLQVLTKAGFANSEPALQHPVNIDVNAVKAILLEEQFKATVTKEIAKLIGVDNEGTAIIAQVDKLARQLEAAETFYPRGLAPEADKVYYLPFPMHIDGRRYDNELYFAKHNQSETNSSMNEGVHILFLLETPALGALKIDMRCIMPRVALDFTVRSKEVAQTLKGNMEQLAQRFSELGLELQHSRVLITKIRIPAQVKGSSSFDKIAGIDIRI